MVDQQIGAKSYTNFLRSTVVNSLDTFFPLPPVVIPTQSAEAVTINFDEFSDFEVIPGDTFQNSNVIFDQELIIVNTNIQRPSQSLPGAALRQDPIAGNLSGSFTEPVSFISVFAGDYRLDDQETVTLRGFDEFGNLLASATFTSSTPQSLSISSPGIVRFEIDNIERAGIDNFTFSPNPEPVIEQRSPSNPLFAPISIPSNPDGSITINFDLDLFSTSNDAVIAGDNFSNLGVIFDDPLRLWNISPEENPVGGSAESSTTIATNDNSVGGNISGFFTQPVDLISVFAGDSGGDIDNVTLLGFDQFGNIVDSDTFENTEAQTLSVSGTGITRFEIQNMGGIAMDNFTFNQIPTLTPEPTLVQNNQLQTQETINFLRSTILQDLGTVPVLDQIVTPTTAESVTINFDQFNDLEVLSGNTFQDLGIVFDQEIRIIASNPDRPAQSLPANAIRNDPAGGNLSGSFTEAVNFISVFAGDRRAFNDDGSNNEEKLTLTGFDEFGNIVDSDTFTALTGQALSISGPGIVRFEIIDENEAVFGIDDLTFSNFSVNPVPTLTPQPTSVLNNQNQLQTQETINFLRSTILEGLGAASVLDQIVTPTTAESVTINFDQFNDLEVLSGNTFQDLGIVFDQEIRIIASNPDRPAQSLPANAIRNDPAGGNLSGSFTEAVNFISVFAGDRRAFNDDGSNNEEKLTLTGFDEFGNIVDSDTFTALTGQALSISGPGIVRFEIIDENEAVFGIDDLTFSNFSVNPVPTLTP
ncbi:MAG: hypothetical protein F6K40_34865, partial [Okeania sp. SIO3I5]|uniref:hypothetical protein n=1 Tax=Okeania sp. SIO3I5 TaxID=2607805 RepID=UPI0013B6215E